MNEKKLEQLLIDMGDELNVVQVSVIAMASAIGTILIQKGIVSQEEWFACLMESKEQAISSLLKGIKDSPVV